MLGTAGLWESTFRNSQSYRVWVAIQRFKRLYLSKPNQLDGAISWADDYMRMAWRQKKTSDERPVIPVLQKELSICPQIRPITVHELKLTIRRIGDKCIIEGRVNRTGVDFLVEGGASTSMIRYGFVLNQLIFKDPLRIDLITANDSPIKARGVSRIDRQYMDKTDFSTPFGLFQYFVSNLVFATLWQTSKEIYKKYSTTSTQF
ncbi:hypothetical protein RF11_09041 [Thelohanellus kitauei]|uniref:Uncharacterized protein n=1 Tax=Thelohanellus kitauei TaxID=669202 RepID=A0A0C2N9X9_THEKT|nr:hypothetical protein RF11_09041 [Thelohanellus kitauei]